MKYFSFVILIFLIGCNPDYMPTFENGKVTALKNGVSWTAEGRGAENSRGNGVDLIFDVFDVDGYLIERLGFVKIPTEVGAYSLHDTFSQTIDSLRGSTYKTIEDTDVTEDRYTILENDFLDSIWVESYDEINQIIRGRFHSKYHVGPPKKNVNNPDSIIFENGEFEATIN